LQIGQLRYFDLELAFQRAGALREDVEDELRAVNYTHPKFLLEVACLCRTQGVIKDRKGRAMLTRHLANISGFAAPNECARINRLQFLLDLAGDGRASALRQRAEFRK
jgi:hypothetical protein